MMLFLLSVAMAQASAVPPETCKERNQPDMPVCRLETSAVDRSLRRRLTVSLEQLLRSYAASSAPAVE